jgi:hypothetical protein
MRIRAVCRANSQWSVVSDQGPAASQWLVVRAQQPKAESLKLAASPPRPPIFREIKSAAKPRLLNCVDSGTEIGHTVS